jgi:hypothetical protein
MDGATPIVVIDTDSILLSLQKASLKNREAHEREKSEQQQQQIKHNGCNGTNGV